ncbi:MAG: hypothetical protein IPP79_13400 [Chitinophagaceae bacterium]|nr:hypothetical protein [Chitinophagaceae bacterium]
MSRRSPISNCYSKTAKNIITPVLMSLLLLLTTINYFIYTTDNNSFSYYDSRTDSPLDNNDTSDTTSPNGPDEKAPNSASSFSEEYVHESEDLSSFLFTILNREHPTYSDTLPLVHFKIFSPPPEC